MTNATVQTRSFSWPAAVRRGATNLAVLGLALTALTGCSAGGNQADDATQPAAASSAGNGSETGEKVVALSDGWAKAADSGMTAVFGKLENNGAQAVTLESVTASGVAKETQLHQTEMSSSGSSQMKQAAGGFTIEPGQTKSLDPGGDHIMLMELECSLMSGANLTVELHFDNGKTEQITVPVRDYAGAQENYDPGAEPSAPGSMASMDGHSMNMSSPAATQLPPCHEH